MGKSIYCEMEISWGIVLEEKSQIFPIRNGSVVTRHHVNFQGENNFSDEYLEGAFEFGIDDLLKLQVSRGQIKKFCEQTRNP